VSVFVSIDSGKEQRQCQGAGGGWQSVRCGLSRRSAAPAGAGSRRGCRKMSPIGAALTTFPR